MANPLIGLFNAPQSLRQLVKRRHFGSQLTGFLLPLAVQDYIYECHDFMDDNDIEGFTGTVDASATAWAYSATIAGGVLTTATGAVDNNYCHLTQDSPFDAGSRPGMEIRFKTDRVTDLTFEIGFTDPPTDATLPGVTDVDTPATGNGVTDIAVVHLDTDQTLTTAALVTDGTTAAAAKSNIGTWSPTADTWHTVRLQILGSNKGAYAIIDNNPALSASVVTGPDTAVIIKPYCLFGTRVATDTNFKVDYFRYWMDR
jgi:hypothetical protein